MKTFRADVLRLLPVPVDQNQLPIGKRLVNDEDLDDPYPGYPNGFGPHTVRLPDNGTGNQTPQTPGTTLVVVYKRTADPLKAVVLYDGLWLKPKNGSQVTTIQQPFVGFFDSAESNPDAKLSLLVGSGAKNSTEVVKLGVGVLADPILNDGDVFFTSDSPSPGSDRAWDAPIVGSRWHCHHRYPIR